ncbi:hypothetical protein Bca52824_007577 [Brassica carinata]|uniref:Uncharacterized protein n=1 Tax=Brassica carinata TaxID=52824 RepID=A0A8X8B5G8_BRACI|nr:hypothetical protein Bca52824_007577 [Brassica carinata]
MSLNDHVSEVMERGGFEEVVDKEVWSVSDGDELVVRKSQVEAFLRLALRCVRDAVFDGPGEAPMHIACVGGDVERYKNEDPVSGMVEVAKDLKLIEKLS